MIKTVIFDIGEVMVDFCWKQFVARLGYPEEINERIAAATIHSPEWSEFDRGVIPFEELLKRFQNNDPEIADEIEVLLTDTDGIVLKREYSIPWVRKLKAAGYQVLALSNFPEKVYLENPEPMQFLNEMDGGILSYRDQVIKPEEAIYKLLQERYHFVPQECVFIDDRQENLDTAVRLGWNTIRYETRQQTETMLAELGVSYT